MIMRTMIKVVTVVLIAVMTPLSLLAVVPNSLSLGYVDVSRSRS